MVNKPFNLRIDSIPNTAYIGDEMEAGIISTVMKTIGVHNNNSEVCIEGLWTLSNVQYSNGKTPFYSLQLSLIDTRF